MPDVADQPKGATLQVVKVVCLSLDVNYELGATRSMSMLMLRVRDSGNFNW